MNGTYTRKVQTVGGGTFTVSLPKAWARNNDVSPGDPVTVQPHSDGTLLVGLPDADATAAESCTVEGAAVPGEQLQSLARIAYRAGLTELRFSSDEAFTDSQRRALQQTVQSVTGLSLRVATSRTIATKSVLDTRTIAADESVRQLLFVVQSVLESAARSVLEPTDPGLAGATEQIDRLCALLERSFSVALGRPASHGNGVHSATELWDLYATAQALARAGDRATRIARAGNDTSEYERSSAEPISSMIVTASELLERAVDGVLDGHDPVAVRSLRTDSEQLLASVAAVTESTTGADDGLFLGVLEWVRETIEQVGPIADIVVRRWLRAGGVRTLASE